MSIEAIDPLLIRVEDTHVGRLSRYFDTHPADYVRLFTRYVYDSAWTIENPEISLKALTLLEPEDLIEGNGAQVLLAINASGILGDTDCIALKQVVFDAIRGGNWDLILHLFHHGLSRDFSPSKRGKPSLLYHICLLGSREVGERFHPYYSDLEFLDQHLELEQWDCAKAIVDRWTLAEDPWIHLKPALDYPLVISYLLEEYRELLNQNQDQIRELFEGLDQESNLELIPFLAPEQILKLILALPVEETDEWLQIQVELEEGGVEDTVENGIAEIYLSRLQHIDWNDEDRVQEQAFIIQETQQFYNRLPCQVLCALTLNEQFVHIIKKSIPLLSFDQLVSVIPLFSEVNFHEIFTSAAELVKINILKTATNSQKAGVLNNFDWDSCEIITNWIGGKYDEFSRRHEEIHDLRYRKHQEPREQYTNLLVDFEEQEMLLRAPVERECLLLERMKRALEMNNPTQTVIARIAETVDPTLLRRRTIQEQLAALGRSLRRDQLFLECRPAPEPEGLVCGIMRMPMEDPVSAHGHVFEREAITTWLQDHNTCPLCLQEVTLDDFQPHNA